MISILANPLLPGCKTYTVSPSVYPYPGFTIVQKLRVPSKLAITPTVRPYPVDDDTVKFPKDPREVTL